MEDIQIKAHFCYPACPAFDKYVADYAQAANLSGADANIGPSLFSLFHAAGLRNVGFDVIQPAASHGPGKQMALITLDRIACTLISYNIETQQSIGLLRQELQQFTDDTQTIISLPRIFRVWGTKS